MEAPRALKIVVVLLAAFVGLELFLRVADYAEPPEGIGLDGTPAAGHSYEPRNPYLDSSFSDATFNVVVFGGAWVFGLGCREQETFPALVEKEFRRNRHLSVRVVNLGQPNFASDRVAGLFGRSLKRYKADAAVVMTGLTDCVPEYLREDYFRRKPFSVGERSIENRVRVVRLLDNLHLAARLNGRDIDPEERRDFVVRVGTLADTQTNLLSIGKAAGKAGVPVIYVTFPRLPGPGWLNPHYPLYSRRNLLIRSTANNFQSPILDLEERVLPGDTAGYLFPWMRWPHPNPKGHALIAEELIAMIEPMLEGVPEAPL